MRRLSTTLLTLFLAAAIAAVAAPIRQMRAAWVVTSHGLDWPRYESDPERQRQQLVEMLDRLAEANFNTLFFQMQVEGAVLWPSIIQPAADDVTRQPNMPLSYDVAQFVTDEAHARGLEVYAIISPLRLGSEKAAYRYYENRVKHPVESVPALILRDNGQLWLNPGNTDALDYLSTLYSELIAEYDFDGLLIDDLSYPSTEVNDRATYDDFNHSGASIEAWRVDNLDRVVATLRQVVTEQRPSMKIALAVDGAPSYDDLGREVATPRWPQLLNDYEIDMVVPKLFTRHDFGYQAALERWIESPYAPLTAPAITPEEFESNPTLSASPPPPLATQIELTASDHPSDLAGVVIYRVSMVTDTHRPAPLRLFTSLRDDAFRYPAHLPVPDLERPTIPYAPENVEVTTTTTDGGEYYLITWDEPQPDAYDTPIKYYTLYIARDGKVDLTDPRSELVHRISDTRVLYPNLSRGLEFAVTAFDANNAESAPAFSDLPDGDVRDLGRYIFSFYCDNLLVAAPVEIDRVEIYSMWGNKVKHLVVNALEMTENCSDLDGGVYVVHTVYADGAIDVNKFIK